MFGVEKTRNCCSFGTEELVEGALTSAGRGCCQSSSPASWSFSLHLLLALLGERVLLHLDFNFARSASIHRFEPPVKAIAAPIAVASTTSVAVPAAIVIVVSVSTIAETFAEGWPTCVRTELRAAAIASVSVPRASAAATTVADCVGRGPILLPLVLFMDNALELVASGSVDFPLGPLLAHRDHVSREVADWLAVVIYVEHRVARLDLVNLIGPLAVIHLFHFALLVLLEHFLIGFVLEDFHDWIEDFFRSVRLVQLLRAAHLLILQVRLALLVHRLADAHTVRVLAHDSGGELALRQQDLPHAEVFSVLHAAHVANVDLDLRELAQLGVVFLGDVRL